MRVLMHSLNARNLTWMAGGPTQDLRLWHCDFMKPTPSAYSPTYNEHVLSEDLGRESWPSGTARVLVALCSA
jgi:hypothetical protein